MAGKNQAEFLIKLLDQVSGPAAKVAASIDKINTSAKLSQTTFESQNAFATRLSNSWLGAAAAVTAASYAIDKGQTSGLDNLGRADLLRELLRN
jgi:hypothetical protein